MCKQALRGQLIKVSCVFIYIVDGNWVRASSPAGFYSAGPSFYLPLADEPGGAEQRQFAPSATICLRPKCMFKYVC